MPDCIYLLCFQPLFPARTDLQASWDAAIQRAFTLPHESNEDIAHIFDLRLCQVQNLRLEWRTSGDLTPAPQPGCLTSAITCYVCRTICRKVTQEPVWTVAQLSHETENFDVKCIDVILPQGQAENAKVHASGQAAV